MPFIVFKLPSHHVRKYLLFATVTGVFLASGFAIALMWPQPQVPHITQLQTAGEFRRAQAVLDEQAQALQERQLALNLQLAPPEFFTNRLSRIQAAVIEVRFTSARQQIAALSALLSRWHNQLTLMSQQVPPITGAPLPQLPDEVFIPIVLYHHTPSDFEDQLQYLERHGYTTVSLDEAVAALKHEDILPTKPVVITYDDGFADQMRAYELLKQHHMKATYYIINGGVESQWCIGASRRYHDPLQPASGCGDDYLTWDQIRTLDRSGLVAVGGHTLDHLNLTTLPSDQQERQISVSKTNIERELGHPIHHFAYPTGAYDAISIQLTHQAGYETAVTTDPGVFQTPSSRYTLRRIRDLYILP